MMDEVALFGAARLGMITHAANNLKVQSMAPDGTVTHTTNRDSAPIPLKDRKVAATATDSAPKVQCSPPAPVETNRAAPAALAAAKRKMHAQAAEDSAEARFWANRVGPAPAAPDPLRLTAAERTDALRRRLMQRTG